VTITVFASGFVLITLPTVYSGLKAWLSATVARIDESQWKVESAGLSIVTAILVKVAVGIVDDDKPLALSKLSRFMVIFAAYRITSFDFNRVGEYVKCCRGRFIVTGTAVSSFILLQEDRKVSGATNKRKSKKYGRVFI